MSAPSMRCVLQRGTRYRVEDGPDRLSQEHVLEAELEVEFMVPGGPFDVFEKDDGEWIYVPARRPKVKV